MSNRLFQSVIYQMKDAVERVIGVIDENGVIISCSELGKIGEIKQGIKEELTYSNDVLSVNGYTYRTIATNVKSEYVVFVEGEDKMAAKVSKILSISLGNIKGLYDEKYDKGSFIRNIILDNILPSDIYIKSKELHFNIDETRVVFLIKFYGKTDLMPFEMLQNMFPDKSRDYVISVGEHDIVLVNKTFTFLTQIRQTFLKSSRFLIYYHDSISRSYIPFGQPIRHLAGCFFIRQLNQVDCR